MLARDQVEREKARVYAPLQPRGRSIGWKELNAGICRVMQDYCGEYKAETTLNQGLRLLGEIRDSEAASVGAANPHELARAVESPDGELIHASLARRASSALLSFARLDYPQLDPPEWHKLLPIRLEDGRVTAEEWPLDYHLQAPYAPTYEENYWLHCEL